MIEYQQIDVGSVKANGQISPFFHFGKSRIADERSAFTECFRIGRTIMNGNNEQSAFTHQRLDEWLGKLESSPDCKVLFERQTAFAHLFPPNENWVKLFTQDNNFPWLTLFAEQIEVARFFADQDHRGWAESFFPHPKWLELFETKTSQLMEKFDREKGQWGPSLMASPEWFKLFAEHPEWAEKLLDKPGWYAIVSSDLELAQHIANDQDLEKAFCKNPEWSQVFKAELKEIDRRRSEKNQDPVKDDLIGLAFSGGGIRSSTFGLGVLEALRNYGLLDKIDYLSTVSGGGYIGSWLSANCQRKTHWIKGFGTKEEQEELASRWNESIRHLRSYSNYLSPKVGFFSADSWTIATVWLRNTLLIQLALVDGFFIPFLIENVYIDLNLEETWNHLDNKGWRNLFT